MSHYCCYECICCTCTKSLDGCGNKSCFVCNRFGTQPPLKTKCNEYDRDHSYDNLNMDDNITIPDINKNHGALSPVVMVTDNTNMTLSDYLHKYRINNDISMSQLAKMLNLSKSEIHRIESGKRKEPSLRTLKSIANVTGVKLSALINMLGYED